MGDPISEPKVAGDDGGGYSIAGLLNVVNERVAALTDQVLCLEKDLHPAMTSEPPEDRPGAPCSPSVSPLYDRIESASVRLAEATALIARIRGRLHF